MRIASSVVNDGYIDEFLTWLFFGCCVIEITRAVSSVIALFFYCNQHYYKANIPGIMWEHLRGPCSSFAAVFLFSSVSYCVSAR
jgi:hypothetical protein